MTAPRRGRRLFRWCVLLTVLATGLYLARASWLPSLARFLDVSESPRQVDAVLVLAGDPETRPFVAAALVKAGLARQVLLTTVRPSPEQQAGLVLRNHEVYRQVLLARGVPESAILILPSEVASTFDEAQCLAAYLQDHPDITVAVVTNAYHTRRTRWVFHQALGERASQLCFIAAPLDGFDDSDWWRHEEGLRAYVTEYLKLAYYLVRY